VFFLLNFDRWSKYVRNNNTIRIASDAAEAQNRLGNWVRANYSCTVDIDTKSVLDATLNNGRLN
jgi:hypothetical protein